MAPVNDQITAMERCEQAVENVLSRMLQRCLLDAHMGDQAPEQFHRSDAATKRHQALRAA